MKYSAQGNTTRQRILEGAAKLFAEKGFTETSVRELANEVGLNSASLYNHFSSKNAILEFMLEDYSIYNTDIFESRDIHGILKENPTADGIIACLQTGFDPNRLEYFLRVLCVLLQEQLRNPIVRSFVSDHIILRAEKNIKKIITALEEIGVLRLDTDPDYWMKVTSSLFYTFATRMMLGIGDNSPEFVGKGMMEMLKNTFEIMLIQCGVEKPVI